MNKSEYLEQSRKLRTPQRCPLVGYCARWMYSVYFFNYWKPEDPECDVSIVLKRHHELPDDFDEQFVKCEVDPPEITKADDNFRFSHFCPEVNLFHPNHSPSFEPMTALSSLYWNKYEGIVTKEYKHFSECLEFIRNYDRKPQKQKRIGIAPKKRFEILERDSFLCRYCGRGSKEGVILHVDHMTSIHDDGSNHDENLITSCEECNFGKGKKSVTIKNQKD